MVDVKTTLDRIAGPSVRRRYRLPDISAGAAGSTDPLEAYSWQELRAII